MKKLHILGLAALLAACSQNDYNGQTKVESDRENEYLHNWIEHFNVPDEHQDWCMLRAVSADISTASLGEGVTTRIYTADPASGGIVLAVAQRDGSLRFDMRKGIDRVFGEVIDVDGNIIAAGMYDISDGTVRIDGSANDAVEPASRYAHDVENGGSWFNAMIACEDLGSTKISDFDFNDIVFGLHRVAGTNTLQVTPMAAGATLSATISITIGDKTHQIGDSHDLIKPGCAGQMLNTENPFRTAGETVIIEDVPDGWTIADAWAQQKFTITVDTKGNAYDISSPVPGSAPKMILLDGDWYWPVENLSIDKAYLGFTAWAEGTGDKTDWVDSYTSLDDVVAWDISKVADNWFSAESTGASYTAKIDNSRNATINSAARYYMIPATSTANMFSGRDDLTSVNITGDHFNTANVVSTSNMFSDCSGLTEIDLSGWNTSSLTNINSMLSATTSLHTLTLDGWDFSKISSSDYVFSYYNGKSTPLKTFNINNAKLKNILCGGSDRILNYVTGSVETINARGCEIVIDNIDRMFAGLSSLKTIDLSGWNASQVTSASQMFQWCSSLETLDLSGWDVSHLTDASQMFSNCSSITSIGMTGWHTNSLQNAASMFSGCSSLETLDLSGWDTSSLTNINKMLYDTHSLQTLTLDGWDLSNITSSTEVFAYGVTYTPLKTFNINNAKLKNILCGGSDRILHYVTSSVETINARGCEIVIDNIDRMFSNLSKLKTIDLSGWNASQVTSASQMFQSCSSLEALNLSGWDVSHLTDASQMFSNCSSIKSIGMTGWHTNSLQNAASMFSGCSSLETLDLSGWYTSSLTNINYMFYGTRSLHTLTLDGWDFSNIASSTEVFSYGVSHTPLKTFNINNAKLKNILIGGSDRILHYVTSSVETINARGCEIVVDNINGMFSGLSKLKNIDLSNWTFSGVTTFTNMFTGCSALESINLTGWVIPAGSVTTGMFSNNASGFTIYYNDEATKTAIMDGNPTLNATWINQ